MRFAFPVLLLVLAGCGGSSMNGGTPPVGGIVNGGFENPTIAPGVNALTAPGWTVSGDASFVSQDGGRPAFEGRQYALLASPDTGVSTLTPALPAATGPRRLRFRVSRPELIVGALIQVFAGERVIATTVPVEGEEWVAVETDQFAAGESVRFVVSPSRNPGAALIDDVRIVP